MQLEDLAAAVLSGDMLTARQWVKDAARAKFDWSSAVAPNSADLTLLSIAAGLAELLAERAGQPAPSWTQSVAPAPAPRFLLNEAARLPRLRNLCETESPLPLRRRGLFAPPDFLTFA